MTDEQASLLSDAYCIIDSFRRMLAGDILEKTGTLYMSPTFEDLESACAMLAEVINAGSFPVLVVSDRSTRKALQAGYGAIDAVKRNAVQGSELEDICAGLSACVYSILNMAIEPENMARGLESAIVAAGMGVEILDGVDAAGTETLLPMYADKSGAKLDGCKDMLRKLFESLRPAAPSPTPEGGQP